MNNESKISFLSNAISDAQEQIRFCDTKTAIVITILGAYVVAFFSSLDKIIKYSVEYSAWFWLFLITFFVLLILCIIVTARIIKPTTDPVENINFGGIETPKLKYFLSPNDYSKGGLQSFVNSSKFKLKENLESYSQQLGIADDNDIIQTLTMELFKVSFIRNIKNDRFHTLQLLLVFTSISIFAAYLFFSIETHIIIEQLNPIPQHN